MLAAPTTIKKMAVSAARVVAGIYAPQEWLQSDRSPLYRLPLLLKKLVRWDYLGPELSLALGQGNIEERNRQQALQLARQGASAWYWPGTGDGPTTLQLAVSLGWCDVAEALLANDRHWFWSTGWGRTTRLRHLASLWPCVDTEEAERLLLVHAPLDLVVPYMPNLPASLYRLSEGLAERGLLGSLEKVHARMPVLLRDMFYESMDLRRWSLRGILFAVQHHPRLLFRQEDSGRMLIHLLAACTQGQDLLAQMKVPTLPLDEDGNTALLAWCLASYQWNPKPISRASYGNPENSMRLLPDCPTQACLSLQRLLAMGVDPFGRNHSGKTAWEQAEEECGFDVWMGLRGSRQKERQWRIELLHSHLEGLSLSNKLPSSSGENRVTRL